MQPNRIMINTSPIPNEKKKKMPSVTAAILDVMAVAEHRHPSSLLFSEASP
jgi:hypothetical protein